MLLRLGPPPAGRQARSAIRHVHRYSPALNGRVPHTSNRLTLADLLDADEADLWPGAGGPLTVDSRPEEMGAIYPHRWAMPREVWARFFESAEHEIGILAYSALFLAEDAGILATLADKGRSGVAVRISLGDPIRAIPGRASLDVLIRVKKISC